MYQPRSDSTADSGPDVDMFCQLARIPRERARLAVPNTGAVEAYWISGRLVLVAVIALCVGPAKNRRNIGRVFCTFSSLIFVAWGSGCYCGQIVSCINFVRSSASSERFSAYKLWHCWSSPLLHGN